MPQNDIEELKEEIAELRHAYCTLVAWISASANAPIRIDEAQTLMQMVEKKKKR